MAEGAAVKLEIEAVDRGDRLGAAVEDYRGDILGSAMAPVVEGATFDIRAAVIRAAVEEALAGALKEER